MSLSKKALILGLILVLVIASAAAYTLTPDSNSTKQKVKAGVPSILSGIPYAGDYFKDTDGDGIVDAKDPNPKIHQDKLTDTDGDGLTNWDEEKVYGTDPADKDTDGDYVSDKLEVLEHGTDPLKWDTDGDTIDDFNELFVYPNRLNPNDPTDVKLFLAMIPNIKAMPIKGGEGGILSGVPEGLPGVLKQMLEISRHDPMMRYYADHTEIIWKETPDGKRGEILVDGEPIWKGPSKVEGYKGNNPSYWLSNEREGGCVQSSYVHYILQKMNSKNPLFVCGGRYWQDEGHSWVEANLDGQDYAMNYGAVWQIKEYYDRGRWDYYSKYEIESDGITQTESYEVETGLVDINKVY